MLIGLVGEDPNDTDSIRNLLSKKYDFSYVTMLNNINGSLLDNPKTKRLLRIECETKNPDVVIFIRDLDGTVNNRRNETFVKRKEYFSSSNSVVDKKGVLLLNIYEIEALILADIETFNKYFNVSVAFTGDPMLQEEPKEFLRLHCKKYTESKNPAIFDLLCFDTVHKNCQYFQVFNRLLKGKLKNVNKTQTLRI
jgi:hypothetical protein